MSDINEDHEEPFNKESLKRNLLNGSTEVSQKSSSEDNKEDSIQNIKAQIFTGPVKKDIANESIQSSLFTFESYHSSRYPSEKSTSSSIGSSSIGPCKTYTTTSTGSIKTEEVRKSSKASLKSHESEESISRKSSIRDHESKLKKTPSYGSEGPCRVFDTVSIEKNISGTSAEEFAHGTIEQILSDHIPISAKGIVTDIVNSAGKIEELSKDITEDMLPPSKSSLKYPGKSDISFTPDDEYLKKHLGVLLTHALVEIVMKQPEDPIHYLAQWLFKWRWNQEHKKQKEDEVHKLTIEQLRIKEETEETKRIEAERKAIEERQMANEEAIHIVEQALGTLDKGAEDLEKDRENAEIQEESIDVADIDQSQEINMTSDSDI